VVITDRCGARDFLEQLQVPLVRSKVHGPSLSDYRGLTGCLPV
jgi:hypothetical protein